LAWPGRGQERAQGRHIYNPARALADHGWQHRLAAVKNSVQVGRQNAFPGIQRHVGQQGIFVAARIVDQHVNAAVPRQNFFDRLRPGFRGGDVQREAETAVRIFLCQLVGVFAT
jgi:hypothetical protein